MTSPDSRRITELGTLKALSHPLRMRLYRALFVARTATASQLADQVDEAVSLISYHLRKLAEHGLIEEAEGRSTDGRERWWQPSSYGIAIRDEDVRGTPELAAASDALSRTINEQRDALHRRFLDERLSWPDDWRSAAISSEWLPRLTAAELAALGKELDAVLRKYDQRARAAEAAGDTECREKVAVHLHGFPYRS
ncbi:MULTISPECIES: helix-turn-helix domain-containing protein [unclassified Streptomyces]|uniref:ArsR/SmtB family transcription factor n=1 Tax=unclassified Streptomyces TaxID=2593676 RepID=UPI0006FCBE8B|nr:MULTISPECIES: helix-turn-helix domain-containing protein [unclassified Streptomyces]KQX53401.1 ArsR family transcriptional regulator [Streptomyces sp. Root1304]KRA90319.1 ArsR family transcriptional regulator [Streptomyces sp. Root66D1]